MNAEAAKLNPGQAAEWEYYLTWYQTHGWVGDEARHSILRTLVTTIGWRSISSPLLRRANVARTLSYS